MKTFKSVIPLIRFVRRGKAKIAAEGIGSNSEKQRREKALQELSSAHSADIRFILATKVELFAAEGGQRKPRGSLRGSLRGSV